MELEVQIISEIAKALELDEALITIDTQSSDIEAWDSLGQISILVRLDEVFNNVSERVPDLAASISVREIVGLISKSAAL
jgi:hypothetical protein